MKNTKKLAISIASFGAAAMCLVGGTFAWYVVSNTGTANISGTTANAEGSLNIGIKATNENAIAALHAAGYYRDPVNVTDTGDDVVGTDIYWAPASVNNSIAADLLESVYHAEGYATYQTGKSHLKPITTGRYPAADDGDESTDENAISLIKKPSDSDKSDVSDLDTAYINDSAADTANYIKFTLAFYTEGQENIDIYLNAENCSFDGTVGSVQETKIVRTLRFGFSSEINSDILSPIYADSSSHTTNVGGELDLNGDGLYDYVSEYELNSDDTTYSYRYYNNWYGEYDLADGVTKLSDAYRALEYEKDDGEGNMIDGADKDHMAAPVSASNNNPWVAKDLYDPGNTTVTSTTTYKFDSSKVTAATQTTKGLRYFTADGGNQPLTKSGSDNIALLDVYVWFEGWESATGSIPNGGDFTASLSFVAPALSVD